LTLTFDQMATVEYADIVLCREKLGKPISMPDAQIASICRVFDYSLATRNITDFENVHVTLINPWEV
jgi:toxin FitB